ncbi:hypothetical protein KJ603_01245 [Patescibacteria group bacterium]|nr:hypothetical protein [Patescibacteria group bacterium]
MNWTSCKFIGGFIFILLVALVFLVYLSNGKIIEDEVDPEEIIAEEQAL